MIISRIFNTFNNSKFEIVIVNNDKERLDDFNQEKISVIELNKNVGFGKSCNIGKWTLDLFVGGEYDLINERK